MNKILFFTLFLCSNQLFGFIGNSSFYGYSQIDFSIAQKVNDRAKFEINRVEVIGDFELSPQSRFLTDIEMEYNAYLGPNGNVGNIKFSQVWAEYSFMPEIKLRAGKILTNFGLYNKIHDASPTYFSISPPLLYERFNPNKDFTKKQRFYGKYLLGSELTGSINLDEIGSQFEYSLMFGNGRIEYVGDTYVEKNTGVSGRFLYRPGFLNGMQIGSSFYTDENQVGIAGVANGRELIAGLEFEYDWRNIQIQSELYISKFKNLSNLDQSAKLSYLQVAYTFDDIITSYLQLNLIKLDDMKSDLNGLVILGLNHAISNKFFIKFETQYHYSSVDYNVLDYGSLKASLSIAF
jgi:hypothetical protein